MDAELSRTVLLTTAASVALFHTLLGVDHYLPFVALGRARGWTLGKVARITALCGAGHVVGSIALGAVGIALGAALGTLEWIESIRGALAAWGLVAFGVVYMAWAVHRLRRGGHEHAHVAPRTFWGMFIVFALGPCEPLIPVLMAPAFAHDWVLVAQVTGLFASVTIATMVAAALVGTAGLGLAPAGARLDRYANLLAGGAIACSGLAIQLLGI